MPSSAWVTVESFTNPLEAHIAKGLLESEGVPSILDSEHHVWAAWPYSQALGGVRLRVAAHRAGAARDILARQQSGEFERALEEQQQVPAGGCQVCGATDFRYTRSTGSTLLLLATLGLASIIFPPRITGRKCNNCGHESRD
jgi:hypothetical protein